MAKDTKSTIATTMEDALSAESNISPSNMTANTTLVAVPGYRNVVHITTNTVDGELQPAHYVIKSAFMPYDKDYRAKYRARMAAQLLACGDHYNKIPCGVRKESPAKLDDEAVYNEKRRVPVKIVRQGGPTIIATGREMESLFFKPINPCFDTQFNGYGEYESSSQMSPPSSESTSYYSTDGVASPYNGTMYGDEPYVSERSESVVYCVDPKKANDGLCKRNSYELECMSAKSFSPTEVVADNHWHTDGYNNDCVRDGVSSASYFTDGVLEEDTVDIDYDYYFVDEWGCISGRNDESSFWKFN